MTQKYIKGKPHCIEERALKTFGTTEFHQHAGYILEDGRMLNFSYDGYIRTEDHRIVGQYFKNKQGSKAMYAFMNRGNIRVICSKSHYGFEFIKKPTKAQLREIRNAYKYALQDPNITFYIEKSNKCGKIIWSSYDIYKLLEEYED